MRRLGRRLRGAINRVHRALCHMLGRPWRGINPPKIDRHFWSIIHRHDDWLQYDGKGR